MTECSEMACRNLRDGLGRKCSKIPKEQNLYSAFAALSPLSQKCSTIPKETEPLLGFRCIKLTVRKRSLGLAPLC
jgi:hypothetical protein